MNENEKPVIRRGPAPIMPMRGATRVSVYKGEVYMAPPGYTCMGPTPDGRMIATNGEVVVEMSNVGAVWADED